MERTTTKKQWSLSQHSASSYQTRGKVSAVNTPRSHLPVARSNAAQKIDEDIKKPIEKSSQNATSKTKKSLEIQKQEQSHINFQTDNNALKSILNETWDVSTPQCMTRQTIATAGTSAQRVLNPRMSIYNSRPSRHTIGRLSKYVAKRVPSSKVIQASPFSSQPKSQQSLYLSCSKSTRKINSKTPLTAQRVLLGQSSRTDAPCTVPVNQKWAEIMKDDSKTKDKLVKVLFKNDVETPPSSCVKAEIMTPVDDKTSKLTFDIECLKLIKRRESLLKNELQQLNKNVTPEKENIFITTGSPHLRQTKTTGMSSGQNPRRALSPAQNRANILATLGSNPPSPLTVGFSEKENLQVSMTKMKHFRSVDMNKVGLENQFYDDVLIGRSLQDDIASLSPLSVRSSHSSLSSGTGAKFVFTGSPQSDRKFVKPVAIVSPESCCRKCYDLEKKKEVLCNEVLCSKKLISEMQNKIGSLESAMTDKDEMIRQLVLRIKQVDNDLLHKERIMWQDREKFVAQLEKVEQQEKILREKEQIFERQNNLLEEKDRFIAEQTTKMKKQERLIRDGEDCVKELQDKLRLLEIELSDEDDAENTIKNNTMILCQDGVLQSLTVSFSEELKGLRPSSRSITPGISCVSNGIQQMDEIKSASSELPLTIIPVLTTIPTGQVVTATANMASPSVVYTPTCCNHAFMAQKEQIQTYLTSSVQSPILKSQVTHENVSNMHQPLIYTPTNTHSQLPVSEDISVPFTSSRSALIHEKLFCTPVKFNPVGEGLIRAKTLVSNAFQKYQDCLLDEEVAFIMSHKPQLDDCNPCKVDRQQMLQNPVSKLLEYKDQQKFQPIKDAISLLSKPSSSSAFSAFKSVTRIECE